MMRRHPRVLVNLDALEKLPASGRRRKEVVDFLKSLHSTEDSVGDFHVTDPESHRPFQVSLVAGYAITWWTDYPVNEIKVVDIRPIT
jgi:hypothetical protein